MYEDTVYTKHRFEGVVVKQLVGRYSAYEYMLDSLISKVTPSSIQAPGALHIYWKGALRLSPSVQSRKLRVRTFLFPPHISHSHVVTGA